MQPALATKGATPPKYQNGFLSSLQPKTTTQSSQVSSSSGMNSSNASMATPAQLGNITGVLTPPVVNVGGTNQVMKGIPSVAKQQQELNDKYGAGLVVDGIAGDKTRAAIAKYTTNASGSSSGTTSGILPTTSADKYDRTTGQPNPSYVDPNAPVSSSTNYSSSNPATFPGLINAGANASTNAANTGATNYATANQGLINSLGQNQVLSDRAQQIANTAGQTISDIGQKGAMGQAGYRTTGTSPVGEGNSAVLAQTTAAQQQAVAQGANMELQGTQQGLTAQGQTQSGYNQAGSMGLTGQGQGITGLNSAAGQIAPSSNFPFVFNPSTGTFSTPSVNGQSGSSSGAPTLTYNPQQDANTLAAAVIANKVPYTDAVSAMGYAGSVAKGLLTSAITALGGNLTEIQARQAATQSNINTAMTTPTNSAASLYSSTYPQVAQLQTTTSNIDQFGNLLLSNMQGLNPTILKGGNATIAQIRSQLSSEQQSQFDTTFAQLKAQVASLLSAGGAQIPTQITADANKIIDGSAPYNTLKATLERIKTEGSILTSNLQQQQNVGGSAIGAPKAGGNTNPLGI